MAKDPITNRDPKLLKRRIELVKEYMRHFDYQPSSLESRLDSSELESLQKIRHNLSEIRSNIESLIESYRARTGED